MNSASIQKTVFKISDFVSWQRIGSLVLSPSFQRRPVWPKNAKSLLIDTIARGIPIPIIFLRQRTNLQTLEPLREVVDGQQRLRTVLGFLDKALLKDFDPVRDDFTVRRSHNRDIAGKPFASLSARVRQDILDYEFSVHVLPSDTDDRELLQIFARMNSTGYKLTAQELRNAQFFGDFKTLAYELAHEQLQRWREWRVFSETDIARMTEVEDTSDFMLLMLSGLHAREKTLLDKIYKAHEERFPEAEHVARRFRATMDRIADTVGAFIPESVFRGRALFNTLFTFYYDTLYGIGSALDAHSPGTLPRGVPDVVRDASARIESQRIPEDLAKVLRGASGDLASRRRRLEFLRRLHDNAKTSA